MDGEVRAEIETLYLLVEVERGETMNCGRKIGPYDCCSVVQGDCLELMRLLPDGCVDAVVTSPPYNMRLRIRSGEYVERETTEHFSKKYAHFHDAFSPEEAQPNLFQPKPEQMEMLP